MKATGNHRFSSVLGVDLYCNANQTTEFYVTTSQCPYPFIYGTNYLSSFSLPLIPSSTL